MRAPLRQGLHKEELENYIEQLKACSMTLKSFCYLNHETLANNGPSLIVCAQGTSPTMWSSVTPKEGSKYSLSILASMRSD